MVPPRQLGTRFPRAFYARDPVTVAQELLGMLLWRAGPRRACTVGNIMETEAYGGRGDRASHAYRGKTPRNAVMFGPPGHAYVYFTYGMHWLLNVVTGREGIPAAVLIRGIEVLESSHRQSASGNRQQPASTNAESRTPSALVNGPSKLTKAFQVTGVLNGEDLVTSRRLWITRPSGAPRLLRIRATPRVGVGYAGLAARWRRRFVLLPIMKKA